MEEISRRQEYAERISPSKTEAHVPLNTEYPFGVYATGDWHLWSEGFMAKQWEEDMNKIFEQPNAGILEMGDPIENGVFSPLVYEQQGPPYMQVQTLNDFCKEAVSKGKWLGGIGGNHPDEWMLKNGGLEFFQMFMDPTAFPRLREGGFFNFEFATGQVYRFLAKHRTRYNSSMNPTHANRRMLEKFGFADVVLRGHTHEKDLNVTHVMKDGKNLPVLLGVTGTYTGYGRFPMQRGFTESPVGGLFIVLHPKKRQMQGFVNLQEGIDFLNMTLDSYDPKKV